MKHLEKGIIFLTGLESREMPQACHPQLEPQGKVKACYLWISAPVLISQHAFPENTKTKTLGGQTYFPNECLLPITMSPGKLPYCSSNIALLETTL